MTKKEQAWLAEYFKDFNATAAAQRAGYKWPNKQGPRNKKKFEAQIRDHIAESLMSADEVLLRLGEIARAEHSGYMDASGRVDMRKLVEDGKGHLVRSDKPTAYGRAVEFHDAHAALRDIGKAQGLFRERRELELPDFAPVLAAVTRLIEKVYGDESG